MRNHGGSLDKLHCVTRVFYISVTMCKIIVFTSRLLSYLILECADCPSCCRGLVLDLKSFDIPPKCRSAFFPSGICLRILRCESVTILLVNITLRLLKNVGYGNFSFIYLPTNMYLSCCLLDVTVSCELNERSRDSYLCDARLTSTLC